MKKILAFFLKTFLQGLVILGPIGVTAYIVYTVFLKLDSFIPYLSQYGPGVSALATIIIILLVGYIGTKFLLGRLLVQFFDYILEHIPGIKFLYTSLKDILISFVGDKKKFNVPVWVKVNAEPEILRVGFITQDDLNINGREKVAVYLPHSYAISGWVIVLDKENLVLIEDMSASEAMKFAVSGGVTMK